MRLGIVFIVDIRNVVGRQRVVVHALLSRSERAVAANIEVGTGSTAVVCVRGWKSRGWRWDKMGVLGRERGDVSEQKETGAVNFRARQTLTHQCHRRPTSLAAHDEQYASSERSGKWRW